MKNGVGVAVRVIGSRKNSIGKADSFVAISIIPNFVRKVAEIVSVVNPNPEVRS